MMNDLKKKLATKFDTLCFAGLGIYLAYIAFSSFYYNGLLYWSGTKTEGTVIEVDRLDRRGSDDLFYPLVQYVVDERRYTISSRHGFGILSRPEISDKFIVYYDAKNPSNAVIYSLWESIVNPALKLAASLFFFFLSGFRLVYKKKGAKDSADKTDWLED